MERIFDKIDQMQLVTQPLSKEEITNLQKESGSYIKLTVDINKGCLVAGGELHADGEKILLKNNSLQDDIWGGGIDLVSKNIDTTAVLNLRPRLNNDSIDILDTQRREKFVGIVRKIFEQLWL